MIFDAHCPAVLWALDRKDDLAINQCEQGVIPSYSDVSTRMKLRSTLAHNDGPGRDRLTAIGFDAQHFWLGIPSVAR
jgi:hypothetical protein